MAKQSGDHQRVDQGVNESFQEVVELEQDLLEEEDSVLELESDKESSRFSSSSSSFLTGSLLDRLRSPTSSELARKRKVDRNPPKGKRRSRGLGLSDPKSITPQQRVNAFKGEYLTVSNNKLFCSACREELSVKCSVVRMHLNSTKHKLSKERLSNKGKSKKDVHTVNIKGETLPEEQRLYRIKVVKTFLRCGVPLNKISEFRELLEENALRLTDRRHMSDLIPFILEQEQLNIKQEIAQKPLAIIFDGTVKLCVLSFASLILNGQFRNV